MAQNQIENSKYERDIRDLIAEEAIKANSNSNDIDDDIDEYIEYMKGIPITNTNKRDLIKKIISNIDTDKDPNGETIVNSHLAILLNCTLDDINEIRVAVKNGILIEQIVEDNKLVHEGGFRRRKTNRRKNRKTKRRNTKRRRSRTKKR